MMEVRTKTILPIHKLFYRRLLIYGCGTVLCFNWQRNPHAYTFSNDTTFTIGIKTHDIRFQIEQDGPHVRWPLQG